MLKIKLSDFLLQQDLLEQAMLWETIGCRVITVPEGVHKAIACCENDARIQFKVDAWPEQQLLPLQPQVVTAPLPLQVKLPAFANRMIAEVTVPSVLVGSGDSVLSKSRSPWLKRNNQKQKNLAAHCSL